MGQVGATPLSDQSRIHHAWFASSGDRIVTCAAETRFQFWDAITGEQVPTEIDQFAGGRDSWSHVDPAGKWILAGSKQTGSRLYDFQTGKALSPMISAFFSREEANAVLSPGGFRLIAFERPDVAGIYDTKTGRKLTEIPLSLSSDDGDALPEGVFEENGKRAWILDTGGVIRCLDTTTWKTVGETIRHPGEGYFKGLEVSADGRFVLAYSDVADCGGKGVACVWDALTRRPVGKPVERSWGAAAEFVDGGKRIRFSFGRGASYVAQLPSLNPDYYLPVDDEIGSPQVMSADGGSTFVSWGRDETIVFTDAATGASRGSYHTHQPIVAVVASPVKDRAVALMGQAPKLGEKPSSFTLKRVDRREGAVPGEPLSCSVSATLMNEDGSLGSWVPMQMSPDGTRVMLLSHGRIRLFQVADLKELASTAPPLTPQ